MTQNVAVMLPPPEPYEGPVRCPGCVGQKISGERFVFDQTSTPRLIVDQLCPVCKGCGRGEHDQCQPSDHADVPEDDDSLDGVDEQVCPFCRGRRWWVCLGFTTEQICHLRVPCDCAKDLLIPILEDA